MEGRDSDSAVSAPEPVEDTAREQEAWEYDDEEGDPSDDGLDESARGDSLGLLTDETPPRPPDWWHRDHPTFTALSAFFTGLLVVAILPAIFYGLMRGFFSERVAEEAFPFVLLFLAVPIGMMVFPHTRRFGTYLLFGMIAMLLVVFGVGTVVLWLMLRTST